MALLYHPTTTDTPPDTPHSPQSTVHIIYDIIDNLIRHLYYLYITICCCTGPLLTAPSSTHRHSLTPPLLNPPPERTAEMPAPSKNEFSRTDLSTLSNYAAARSTNIDLQWSIDFEQSVISGSVTHTIEVVLKNTPKVKFDSSKLHISAVSVNGAPATYERAESSPCLGTCLAVEIPASLREIGSKFDVTFHYSTDRNASAVQWLSSKATSSGKYPFVFTQVILSS